MGFIKWLYETTTRVIREAGIFIAGWILLIYGIIMTANVHIGFALFIPVGLLAMLYWVYSEFGEDSV